MSQEDIQDIINLIQACSLDQTIKDILVRDLQAEGLSDFLREQIKAYCLEGKEQLKQEYQKAKLALEKNGSAENPA